MNSSLKLFTQPDVLLQLGVGPLRRFLSHFINSDARLASLDLDSPYLCSELARLFTQPQSLSPRLCETLVLLESATLPEHHDRLAALAQQRLPDLCASEFHPLALALELWLTFPDDLTQICSPALRSAFGEGGSSSSSSITGSAARAASGENLLPHEPWVGESACPLSAEVPIGLDRCPPHPCPLPEEREHITQPNQESTHPSIHLSASASSIEHPSSSIQNPASSSLLASLASLLTRYVILPEHAAEALALSIVHTYAFELRDVTTYLGLESPVRRCGKSTLLTVLSRLVNRPLVAANVSPSALYRAIEELRPTLMIDEADTFLKPNDELIGILNAGYHRATAYVLRVSHEPRSRRRKKADNPNSAFSIPNSTLESSSRGNEALTKKPKIENRPSDCSSRGNEALSSDNSSFSILNSTLENSPVRVAPSLARFSCWCPKIIARIGRLPETLADRCIVIRMQRKTPNDQCERLRDLDMIALRQDLRQQCAQFVQDHRDAIISAKPAIPAALNDRAADIWEPLLALADCAGGDWPALAREAALALSSDTRENNPIGSLLLDIFVLFAASGHDRIPTRALVDALNTQFTDRPWMDTRKGQRSTEMWLSEQLRPFGINPRTFRSQDSILRGYDRDDFDEAFRRYIPQSEMDTFRAQAEKNVAQAIPARPPASGTHRDET